MAWDPFFELCCQSSVSSGGDVFSSQLFSSAAAWWEQACSSLLAFLMPLCQPCPCSQRGARVPVIWYLTLTHYTLGTAKGSLGSHTWRRHSAVFKMLGLTRIWPRGQWWCTPLQGQVDLGQPGLHRERHPVSKNRKRKDAGPALSWPSATGLSAPTGVAVLYAHVYGHLHVH